MSERLEIVLNFEQAGDAPASLKKMADEAKRISDEESRYQDKLKRRVQAIKDTARMQGDLVQMGMKSAPLDAEEAYQQKLRKRIDILREQKRLQEDLVRLGAKQDPELLRQIREGRQAETRQERQAAREEARIAQERRQAIHERQAERNQPGLIGRVAGRVGAYTGIGRGVGGGMAVGAAAMHGMQFLTKFGNVMSNEDMAATGNARDRALFRMLPFGETIQGFGDMLSGRTEGMRHLAENLGPKLEVNRAGYMRQRQAELHYGERFAEAKALADARKLPPGLIMRDLPGDRTTVGGEIEYRQAERLLPIKMRMMEIGERETATSVEKAKALERVKSVEAEMNRLYGVRHQLLAEVAVSAATGKPLTGPELERNLLGQREVNAKIAGMTGLLDQSRETYAGISGRHAQTRSEARRAGIDHLQAELGFAQEKEGRIAGRAERFAAAGPGGRAIGMAGFEMVKGGFDVSMMPPELMGHMQALDPALVQKMLQNSGDKLPELQKFKEMFKDQGIDQESLRQAREQVENVRGKIQLEVRLDREALARDILEAMEEAFGGSKFDLIKNTIRIAMEAQKRAIEIGLGQKYNQ